VKVTVTLRDGRTTSDDSPLVRMLVPGLVDAVTGGGTQEIRFMMGSPTADFRAPDVVRLEIER
jgi:hypothetical protein